MPHCSSAGDASRDARRPPAGVVGAARGRTGYPALDLRLRPVQCVRLWRYDRTNRVRALTSPVISAVSSAPQPPHSLREHHRVAAGQTCSLWPRHGIRDHLHVRRKSLLALLSSVRRKPCSCSRTWRHVVAAGERLAVTVSPCDVL